ncbi:hypothetical protein H0274_01775 [Altererythrobacter sp. CC-YST694]|uniref:BRO-N domain-containing protein n=1 Tax=Altererythrobacter sp. CC-YST694 TaxID=2755038 RepID=UPI001D008B76|nr:BRO family protein [Altererythrobacter sp. CC-YST694]MCB5423974.1 hypothetical protein [Altererythrobacter sp. CC-YST694]
MNNELALFEFGGSTVRVVHLGDQPWWVATDLAAVLGYRNASDMIRKLDDDQKGTHKVRTLGGDQEATVVNESGMWSCVIRSQRDEAKAFQRILTGDILPSLRRQGFYALPGVHISPPASVAELLRVGNALKKERDPRMRAMLEHRLDQIADSWNVARVPHGSIGFADPDYSGVLQEFWSAVNGLEEAGLTINHSRRNHLIALYLPEIRRHFAEVGVPIDVDRSLTLALRSSKNPEFVADKPVNCPDGAVRHCWVFSRA